MSALSSLTVLICCAGVGVGMLSVLVPQQRTRRILGFVLGLFVLVTPLKGVGTALEDLHLSDALQLDADVPTYSDEDYLGAVAQQTADILVSALDELLREEDIIVENIRLNVKISDEGRIYADRIDIYISEAYRSRKDDIRAIVYANLSKEPGIYVKGQEVE